MKPFPVKAIWKPGHPSGIVLATSDEGEVLVAWDDHTIGWENPGDLTWVSATSDWPITEAFAAVAFPKIEAS